MTATVTSIRPDPAPLPAEPPAALQLRIFAGGRKIHESPVLTYGQAIAFVTEQQAMHTIRIKGFVRAGHLDDDGAFVFDRSRAVVAITLFT